MNSSLILRSIVIYAICVPVAIFLGYELTDPQKYTTYYALGVVLLILVSPLLMKWHYPLLLFSWFLPMYMVFVKGSPTIWLLIVVISLIFSVFERSLNKEGRFIQVHQMVFPLIAMVTVIVVTAKLTGGFGLRSFGSNVWGGRKYILLIVGIVSYFAITSRRIPPERAKRYVTLFLAGGVISFVSDLYVLLPDELHFIFWLLPPSSVSQEWVLGTTRLGGIGTAGFWAFCILLARYGIRGIFYAGKPWRILLLIATVVLQGMGGYRSILVGSIMLFGFQFFLEGMHRTKLLPALAMAGLVGLAVLLPFASKLPFALQRTLAFLPLGLDTEAVRDAQGSTEWRILMWQALWPQVPRYLLKGKGYTLTAEDFPVMGVDSAFRSIDPSQEGLAVSGDYHNGPLSVIIPFGIWGGMAFLWFLGAGAWVTYKNYRNGDPGLRLLNSFLLALYLKQVLYFFVIFGALSGDMGPIVGTIGLSIAINGGVRRRAGAEEPEPEAAQTPVFLPRTRPLLQR